MSKTGFRLSLNLNGPEGNAYAVVSNVCSVLREVDRNTKTNYEYDYFDNVFNGNYEDVLKKTCEYVDLFDESGNYEHLLREFRKETV